MNLSDTNHVLNLCAAFNASKLLKLDNSNPYSHLNGWNNQAAIMPNHFDQLIKIWLINH